MYLSKFLRTRLAVASISTSDEDRVVTLSSFVFWRSSAVKTPACGSVRLCGSNPKGNAKREAVYVPGRRTGTRRTIWCCEGVILHLCRPATLAVQAGYLIQRWMIGDSVRLAFQNEVDTFQFDRDCAGWVCRQIA